MSILKWGPPTSAYTQTHKAQMWFLQAQVRWRFGKAAADCFNPAMDVATSLQWWFLKNYRIKLGEKALRGIALIPREKGNSKTRYRLKVVYLFHRFQTVPR